MIFCLGSVLINAVERLMDFGGILEIKNRIRISCGQRRGTGEGGMGEGWLPVDLVTGE